ncbi:MAG TPA: DUF5343 domain-containing protein [Candidatus Micrarchaeia archaeon]|nr:DUF5343 domain-containing protein [Candidatus Micrarchaeia archaeon]
MPATPTLDPLTERPYAAAANVVTVLTRIRSRNLPDTIGDDFYRVCGIGEFVFGRVTRALTFLGLISEDGAPLDRLKAIAAATEADYRELLAAAVREAYAADFKHVDPTQDPQLTIVDHFRRYQPRSQTIRMVMLFLGLCREAAIPVRDAPRDRKMASRSPSKKDPSRRPVQTRVEAEPRPIRGGTSTSRGDGSLLNVTVADIGALGEEEFVEVWAALGKVARARARLLATPPPEQGPPSDGPTSEGQQEEP